MSGSSHFYIRRSDYDGERQWLNLSCFITRLFSLYNSSSLPASFNVHGPVCPALMNVLNYELRHGVPFDRTLRPSLLFFLHILYVCYLTRNCPPTLQPINHQISQPFKPNQTIVSSPLLHVHAHLCRTGGRSGGARDLQLSANANFDLKLNQNLTACTASQCVETFTNTSPTKRDSRKSGSILQQSA